MDDQLSYSSSILDNPLVSIGGIFGLGLASQALENTRFSSLTWRKGTKAIPGELTGYFNTRKGPFGGAIGWDYADDVAQKVTFRKGLTNRARRVRRMISNKYGGDVGAFMRRGRLADVSPAADKYINKLTRNPFKRARLREYEMHNAIRRASPQLANRMLFFHGLRGLMGGLNTYFTAQMVGFGINMVNDMASSWRPKPRVNKRQMLELGGDYIDTREAYTQRQRALQAIHNSQLTTRAVIGNEASMLHYD